MNFLFRASGVVISDNEVQEIEKALASSKVDLGTSLILLARQLKDRGDTDMRLLNSCKKILANSSDTKAYRVSLDTIGNILSSPLGDPLSEMEVEETLRYLNRSGLFAKHSSVSVEKFVEYLSQVPTSLEIDDDDDETKTH